ncbi:MAG: class I SAM-dependent methyltransferase [Pseudomonadota bacterium]
MPTETDVTAAFRWILGRPPEDDAARRYHAGLADDAALRATLLGSAEFAAAYAGMVGAAEGPGSPANRPGHGARAGLPRYWRPAGPALLPDALPEETARLFAEIAEAWQALGETEPHYSVLTHEAFRQDRLETWRADFEASADEDAALIDDARTCVAAHFGRAMEEGAGACLELGAGVGRVTRRLATRFATVAAVDISSAHLAVAETELRRAGHGNIRFHRLGAPGDLATLPAADFAYCRLVLQHNPPPVQAAMIAGLLKALRPGGAALFQTVSRIEGYAWDAAADAARRAALRAGGGGPEMEMHALAQGDVFRLIAAAGCVPLEVDRDTATGEDPGFLSHMYLAVRP